MDELLDVAGRFTGNLPLLEIYASILMYAITVYVQWRKEPTLPSAIGERIGKFVGRVAAFAASVQVRTAEPVPHDVVNGVNGGGNLHGSMPAWFDPVTLAPRDEMRFNSETAAVAFFLADAHGAGLKPPTGGTTYLQVAEAAMDFIEREIVPSGRWYCKISFDESLFMLCLPFLGLF